MYQSWARSRPTLVPESHSAKVYRQVDRVMYARNLTGTADVALECFIEGLRKGMNLVQFTEEDNKKAGAAPREKLLIEQVVSTSVPELKPYEFSTIFMQRNGPGAMPGCKTTTDQSLGGGVIKGTAQFYKAVACLSASIDFLPQDFGFDPNHKEHKPAIYLIVKGIDLDDHKEFMDDEKRPGGSNLVHSKHPVMTAPLGEGQT